jgi:UDP-glucose 4-epimerase
MHVLVTGAAGRVGSWLTQHLIESGYEVRAMVRPEGRSLSADLTSRAEVVEAALTDSAALTQAMADVDVVVHLAAQILVGDAPLDNYYDVNVGGTLRLLEASVRRPTPVRRFIHASTDNTYGPVHPQQQVITEDHPQEPGDYYGTSKVLAEHLVRNFHKIHGLEYSILRLGSILAPEEAAPIFRLDWVRSFFAAHAEAGDRSNLWQLFAQCHDPVAVLDQAVGAPSGNPAIALAGPDDVPWSVHFTDVRDVVDGVMLAIDHDAAANEDFNLVGPRTTTFAEGAAAVAKHFDTDVLPVRMPIKLAFELSNAKASNRLGYAPRRTFEDTLAEGAAVGMP